MRKSPMRICMVTTIFPPTLGGPATQCFNLCAILHDQGLVPVVVTYGQRFTHAKPDGYSVYTFRERYGLGPIDRLLRWLIFPFYIHSVLRREKIDILHCHSVNVLSFISAIAAKTLRIPRIVKFAGDWVWETLSTHKVRGKNFEEVYRSSWYSLFLTMIERKGIRFFNLIWTPSESRNREVEFLINKNPPSILIPNCLRFTDPPSVGPRDQGDVVIVSANRFIPHKRIPWIVELYAQVRTAKTRLVLIGDGTEAAVVKDAIARYQLEDSVICTGRLSSQNVYEQFKKASIYISASLDEGLPNVFIEAMHYGLPIVATDVGGSAEMVKNNLNGFILQPDDQDGFIGALRKLINEPDLRLKMGAFSAELSKQYDLQTRVGEFIAMYENLLAKKSE